jgi:hypothetical protein
MTVAIGPNVFNYMYNVSAIIVLTPSNINIINDGDVLIDHKLEELP